MTFSAEPDPISRKKEGRKEREKERKARKKNQDDGIGGPAQIYQNCNYIYNNSH